MAFSARLFLQVGEWTVGNSSIGAAIQSVVIAGFVAIPNNYAEFCAASSTPEALKFVLTLIFRSGSAKGTCPIFYRWFSIYVMCYVWSYHYIRPAVNLATKHLPSGPTWAAVALSASMVLGVAAAAIHYPFLAVDAGTGMVWLPYEVLVGFIQPTLFALAMTQFPFDMAWWGNTSLGCYVFHFYIRHRVTYLIWAIIPVFAFDPTGLLLFIAILSVCILIQSTVGPAGHYCLVGLQYLPGWVWKVLGRGVAKEQSRKSVDTQA